MCTNPITITRNFHSIGTRTYTVPCGKCAECAKKKQSEFNALALHQALKSGMVYMFTFTYDPLRLPIAISESDGLSHRVVGFERGQSVICDFDSDFKNCVVAKGGLSRAASLHREDIKLIIKRFRSMWPKQLDVPLEFKYAVFGEYGENRGRPHYHGLFFGLSLRQAQFLKSLWSSEFGFAHFGPISGEVSMVDIMKITSYASKYISKGVHSRWKFLEGYVEPPRRQSSLNFGSFDEKLLSALKDFMTGAICPLLSPSMRSCIRLYLDALPCQ